MIKLKVFEDSNLFYENDYSEAQEVTVGRGSQSDIILKGHPGISRDHLKIVIGEGSVEVMLVSKTGKLIKNSQNIKEVLLTGGEHVISIPPYDFNFTVPQISQEIELESSLSEYADEEDSLMISEEPDEENVLVPTGFDEDEKTKTAIETPLEYSVKVFKGSRLLQELALDGDSWDFGRDQDCHYTIKSKKTSRKHFTISSHKSKFFVKDLGSSNGTFLNNQQLPSNQEIEIKSGDYIEVSEFKFIFEIKDNSFEEKFKDVALLEQFGSESTENNNLVEIDSLRENALAINDEFLRLPEKDRFPLKTKTAKEKYLRPALICLIIAMFGGYYYLESGNGIDEKELAAIAAEKRMQREKVNAAVDRFNLALRFYNESQFERCILEIDEFLKYDVQIEETAGAAELKNQCDIEKERLQRKRDLEIQEQKKREIAAQVESLISRCKPFASEGTLALKPCIEPIYGLDPSNEQASALMDIAEATDLRIEKEREDAVKYKKNVASGRALFKKAQNYDKFGDWKRALKAYNKHIKSGYPDPSKLKRKAKRNIAAINLRIQTTLEQSINEAKEFQADDDFKNAILAADKGLDVNRDHAELLRIKKDAERSLKIILRKYYQESIIEEDFGQIDEAKIKWKKIIDQGVEGSDYHKKARLKLKYYEEGV